MQNGLFSSEKRPFLFPGIQIDPQQKRNLTMGFRFWRRIRIAPGITLNLSKSGGSLSFGPRGAKFTIGPRGKRATVGIPGTGLFYTTTFPSEKSGGKNIPPDKHGDHSARPEDRLTLGFFKRLITPDDEEALVDGCRELALGDEDKAFHHLEKAIHLADGAYLAGFLALKKGDLEKAENYLGIAWRNHDRLGQYFSRYGIAATMSLSVTDEISVHVGPNIQGVLLGLSEIYQQQERWKDALESLEKLRQLEPDDVMVRLALAELLIDAHPDNIDIYRRIVRLSENIKNESPVHGALLLYKARALHGLGLLEAARDTLTNTMRKKKGRSKELLLALRYERALVYEDLGQQRRARGEFEKIYSMMSGYEDVESRLGL